MSKETTTASSKKTSKTGKTGKMPAVHTVKRDQLPFSCPPEDSTLWNMHPRVYLPLEKTGKATCPYCGAVYVLSND